MIPLPYNSDAPLYHWPIATGGLILLNLILYICVPSRFYSYDTGFIEMRAAEQLEEDPAPEPIEAEDPDAPLVAPDWAKEGAGRKVGAAAVAAQRDILSFERGYPFYTLALQHGAFKPWQWVTSLFLHYDPFHLIFNMIALWAFGLVVEGKVGSWVFLLLYVAMGALSSGLAQILTIFSSSETASIGSTTAIYATLGVAVVWAPKNEFDCFWSFGFRMGTVEIPVMIYGAIIFAVQGVYGILLSYFTPSAILQVLGIPIGFAVGFVWLKSKWVDCEGWDILNVWKNNEGHIDQRLDEEREAHELVQHAFGKSSQRKLAQDQAEDSKQGTQYPVATVPVYSDTSSPPNFWTQPAPTQGPPELAPLDGSIFASDAAADTFMPPLVESTAEVVKLIHQSKFVAAALMYRRVWGGGATRDLSQPLVDRLMRGLLAEKQFDLAAPVMAEHVERFTENRLSIQLNLAKVLLHLQRPSKAVAVLKSIDRTKLDAAQKPIFQKLASHAKSQLEAGVIELQ